MQKFYNAPFPSHSSSFSETSHHKPAFASAGLLEYNNRISAVYFQSLYVENFPSRPSIWDEVSNLFLICRQPSRGTFCQSSYSHHSITQTIKIYCLFCQEPKNQPNRMIKFIGSVQVCWIIKIRLMKISFNSSFIYFHSAFKTAILDADGASL